MTFVTRNSDNDTIAVQNFQEYLRIKTVYPNPDYESCNAFLERLAKDVGLDFQSIECVKGKPIAIMTMPGRRPDLSSLMLNSHTDVVQVFEDKWTQDPFGGARVKQENGDYKIYGRGSQDMKIVGITYVEAIRRLKQLGWQPLRTIHITFVPDEEIGGDDGMQALLLTDTFKKMNVGLCLDEGMANPENAYKLYYGERIGWWCRITAHGNTGHGSQFIKNVAINKLMPVISALLKYRDEQEALLETGTKHGRPLRLGDVTSVNLTMIEGGVQHNVIPESISAVFDIRITPDSDVAGFIRWVEDLCAKHDLILTSREKCTIAPITPITDDNPWWRSLRDACQTHNIPIDPEIFPAATDSRYVRYAGIPAFGISPLRNTPILLHDHDEFVYESGFLEGIQVYQHLIKALADTPPF